MQDARDEVGSESRHLPRAARVVQHRLAVAVEEAEVDMSAAADAVWIVDRRETDTVAQAERHCLRKLARDHGFVRGAQAQHRRGGHLELLWPILCKKRVGNDPGLAQG